MSFKNKMKNRGISKLDNLVETPEYITPVKKPKSSWNWLKIAIPVTAGLALVIIPISIVSAIGFKGNRSAQKGENAGHSTAYDPTYDGESYAPGSASNASFAKLLNDYNIGVNCTIEVYDYADGYLSPTYTFEGEDVTSIINSIKTINSDYSTYSGKVNSASRNTAGYLMGINHKLIFKDGTNKMVGQYFSQFVTLLIDSSAFDLTGSQAYTIMDSHIEMDYDPTFDETINL